MIELSRKEQRVAVFEDTLRLISANSELTALTEKAKQDTRMYMEGFCSENRPAFSNTAT